MNVRVGGQLFRQVEGTRGSLHRHLFGSSPEADPTGVSIRVVNGHYTLRGDGDDGTVRIDAGKSVVLDPDRITASSGEWTVTRPGSSSGYRYKLVVGEDPTFVLQHFQQPDEPGGDPSWVDVTATRELQTTARLRPKPARVS